MKRHFIAISTIATMNLAAAPDYAALAPALDTVVQSEMRDWGIGGVAVALFDDSGTVLANGYGEAQKDAIFRVGSVSKLFNAIAVMQLVEKGKLDLDAPLPDELLPENPFADAPAVTLRQLLCHRSGLQREVTVGGYFDASEPGLAATVGDLRTGVLVTVPGAKTRYSNVGASLAGLMVERAAGTGFPAYQRAHLLGPLGMESSAWTLAGLGDKRVITSHMRVADGQGGWTRREAPLFDLGTIPAGNLFSTVEDIARFGSALLRDDGTLVKPETLKEMWTPQLTDDKTGFGIGFAIGTFRDKHRSVGHNGAVYGHSTAFTLLPHQKLGVVAVGNEDIANGRIHRVSLAALALALEAKTGEKETPRETTELRDPERFLGDYESPSYWARIDLKDGALVANFSGQPATLTPVGVNAFLANSKIESDNRVEFALVDGQPAASFTRGGQTFTRVPDDPPSLREEWRKFLGSYGPEFIPLVVSERHGHLYAMTENMVDYRLTPRSRYVCDLCPGMYTDEQAVFLPDANGRIHAIDFASVRMQRRD